MSESPRFRRWAVTLVLVATAAASIATSPAPTVMAWLEPRQFTLTAEQPALVQQVRARLELKDDKAQDEEVRFQLHAGVTHVPAVAAPDAGAGPVESPRLQLVIRDEAHPDAELYRGDPTRDAPYGFLSLMSDCHERTCEQTLRLEWSLPEGTPPPVDVYVEATLDTSIDEDEGRAVLEWAP